DSRHRRDLEDLQAIVPAGGGELSPPLLSAPCRVNRSGSREERGDPPPPPREADPRRLDAREAPAFFVLGSRRLHSARGPGHPVAGIGAGVAVAIPPREDHVLLQPEVAMTREAAAASEVAEVQRTAGLRIAEKQGESHSLRPRHEPSPAGWRGKRCQD